jgi:hypothetical protein
MVNRPSPTSGERRSRAETGPLPETVRSFRVGPRPEVSFNGAWLKERRRIWRLPMIWRD